MFMTEYCKVDSELTHIMSLGDIVLDECSLRDFESCPSAKAIKELLATIHKSDQSQKLQSEIPSAFHQHVHHSNLSNDIQSPLSKGHPMPNLLHSLSEEQLTETVIATVSGDEKTSDDEVEYAKSPSVDFEKKYSVIPLLDALNHLKCDHGVDENNDEFDKIFAFFEASLTGNHCDVNDCEHVKRHYSDRRRRQRHYQYDQMVDHKHEQLLDTISMIHCYFVHSFDIDRLTKEERERVKQEAKDEHDQMTVMTNILIEKRKKLKYVPDSRRGGDGPDDNEKTAPNNITNKMVDFVSMAESVAVDEVKLKESLGKYKTHRNRLIRDLIDVVYGEEEEKTAIWDKLEMEDKEKVMTFRSLLFDHFKCYDLNNKNFMKMSEYIIGRRAIPIDHNEVHAVLRWQAVDGKTFDQMDMEQFGGLFEEIPDKDGIGQLYAAFKKWRYTESTVSKFQRLPSVKMITPATTKLMAPMPLVGAVIEIGIESMYSFSIQCVCTA